MFDDMNHYARAFSAFTSTGDPMQDLLQKWKLIGQPYYTKSGSGSSGAPFEYLVYDAIRQCGVREAHIKCNIDLSGREKNSVEADLFIDDGVSVPLVLMSKTSLAERWKQIDRDAIAIRFSYGRDYEIWGVFYRKPSETDSSALREAVRVTDKLFAPFVRVVTILDQQAMQELGDSIRKRASS